MSGAKPQRDPRRSLRWELIGIRRKRAWVWGKPHRSGTVLLIAIKLYAAVHDLGNFDTGVRRRAVDCQGWAVFSNVQMLRLTQIQ